MDNREIDKIIESLNNDNLNKEQKPISRVERFSEKTSRVEQFIANEQNAIAEESVLVEEPVKKPKKSANKLKKRIKITLSKTAITVIAIALVIIVAGIAAGIAYNYSRTAYLKPYIQKYNVEFPDGILEEMCDAYGENQNVVGKIECNGEIVYVAKTHEYEYANLQKGSSFDGNEFTSINASKVLDLEKYFSSAEKYMLSDPIITLTTLKSKANYAVVAAYYTNNAPADDGNYVFPYNCYGNMTEDSFKDFRDNVYSRQLYYTGDVLKYDDKVLNISCDTDFMKEFKFVVVLKQVDDDYKKPNNISVNNNPRYPQVYYDVNNKRNSFIFAKNWYPEIIDDDKDIVQLSILDFE